MFDATIKTFRSSVRPHLHKLARSVWLFPLILTTILLGLTALKISGSSVGTYHTFFYGNTKNPDLLLNQPQPIRSDEWLVVTQMTIAQHAAGYPRINPNIDHGRDMSVQEDVPYKEWSVIFKPQNLIFFILPFENAFAFKWWFLLYLLIISCYFVTLKLLPKRRLLAALFSTATGLSPFVFWWYQTATIAPLFYGLFILLIGLRIIHNAPFPFLHKQRLRYSYFAYVLLLSYLLISFALVMYPPFQIPIALTVAAFLSGALIDKHYEEEKFFSRTLLIQLGSFLTAILIAGAVVLLFLHTRSSAINALANTVYPGKRVVQGGGTPIFVTFNTYLQPQLERAARAASYYTNQSEASNFLLFLPFTLIPGIVTLALKYRKLHRIDWTLLFITLLVALFFANLFLNLLQPIYHLTFLDKVPHPRLFIGLGFIGVLQLLLFLKAAETLPIQLKPRTILAASYTLVCLLPLLWTGNYVRSHYPGFAHSIVLISLLALLFGVILFCFLTKRLVIAMSLLLIFSVGCVFHIHPLYRGLKPLSQNKLLQTIDAVSPLGATWVTLDDIRFENVPALANRDSLTGVQAYPDVAFWRQVEGKKGNFIYNRYAHVLFNSSPDFTEKLKLIQFDTFQVQFACTPFIKQNVQFALATHPVTSPCVQQVGEVRYPAVVFYLYKVR